MKRLLFLLLFIPFLSFGQIHKVQVIGMDTLTTAERDGITVPGDRVYLIYNETAGEWQYSVKGGAWQTFGGGGGLSDMDWDDPVDANIAPNADGTIDFGTSALSFNDAWFDGTINAVDITSTGTFTFGDLALTPTDTEPGAGTPSEGQIYFDDSENSPKYYNGTSWLNMGGDVTASSAFGTDNTLIRADGTGKGVQSSGWSLADNDVMTAGGLLGSNESLLLRYNLDATGSSDSFDVTNGNGISQFTVNNTGTSANNLLLFATDTEPTATEGRSYSDDSENRPKYYDGTSWKAYLLDGDVSATADVSGPASSTDNAIARFDGTGGKTLQNSGVTINDSGDLDATGTIESETIIVGDGTTDRTTDIETALSNFGEVFILGDVVTTSAITLSGGDRIIGSGKITNNTTDVFVVNGTNIHVDIGEISSNAGHLFTFTGNTFNFSVRQTRLNINNTGKSAFYLRGLTGVYDMVIEGNYIVTGPNHTVPMIDIVVDNENFNENRILYNTFQTNGSPTAEVIHLETTVNTNWIFGNEISGNLFEVPTAGAIHLYSVAGTKVNNNTVYDLPTSGAATADMIYIDNNTGGLNSAGVLISGYHRVAGDLSTNTVYDINNQGAYASSITVESAVGIASSQLLFNGLTGHTVIGGYYISNYGGATAIEPGADVTDEANVTDALDGATLTDIGTPASTDKILIQDASDSDNLKYAAFSEFGSGNVSNTGTPLNNELAVWTDATTVEGDPNIVKNASNLTLGSSSQTDLLVSAAGSSFSDPATLGMTGYSSGKAARWQFGDATNTIENSWGNGTAISSFHTLVLAGGHEGLESGQVDWASSTFTTDNAEGLRVALKDDRKAVFWQRNATARSVPFLEFQENDGTVVASVDASGNMSTTGTISLGDNDYGDITVSSDVWYLDSSAKADSLSYDNVTSGLTATNVQAAIDELEATVSSGLSTENQARIDNMNEFRVLTVSTDLQTSAAANARTTDSPYEGKVRTEIDGNYTYYLSGNENLNTPFYIEATENVTDSVQVIRDDGAITMLIDGKTTALTADDVDGFSLKALKTAVVERTGTNEYKATCDCLPITIATCTADPNEVHTTANAASDPNCNEANATTDFSENNTTYTVLTSESTGQNVGDYAIKQEVDVGSSTLSNYFRISLTVTSGTTYNVTFDLKSTQSANNRGYTNWQGINTSVNNPNNIITADGVWRSYSETIETNSTTLELRFYTSYTSGASVGDDLWLDNLSVIPQ